MRDEGKRKKHKRIRDRIGNKMSVSSSDRLSLAQILSQALIVHTRADSISNRKKKMKIT